MVVIARMPLENLNHYIVCLDETIETRLHEKLQRRSSGDEDGAAEKFQQQHREHRQREMKKVLHSTFLNLESHDYLSGVLDDKIWWSPPYVPDPDSSSLLMEYNSIGSDGSALEHADFLNAYVSWEGILGRFATSGDSTSEMKSDAEEIAAGESGCQGKENDEYDDGEAGRGDEEDEIARVIQGLIIDWAERRNELRENDHPPLNDQEKQHAENLENLIRYHRQEQQQRKKRALESEKRESEKC